MMSDEDWMREAERVATGALCQKARCGTVVVKDSHIVGTGFNAPPQNQSEHQRCHLPKNLSGKAGYDQTCCVHAEWRAILDGLKNTDDLSGASLYFARIDKNGAPLPAGEPFCTVCSRLALDTGIATFFLRHTSGIVGYPTGTYNTLSYQYTE